MITVLSDDKQQNQGKRLYELIKEKGIETEYISTTGLNIKPCYSCGACSTKTYGKCILVDDMDPILRKLIRTDKLILATPVTWGSYSSDIKKILDRTAIIGDSHYYVKKGELIKGMRSNLKHMFAIGVKNNCSTEEIEEFASILFENVKIMNIDGKAFVVNEDSKLESMVEEICR
jgi:multimeric flavodoxin WrbA